MNTQALSKTIALAALAAVLMTTQGQAAQSPANEDQSREQRLEAARERLEQAAREVAELSLDGNGGRQLFTFGTMPGPRAALGINIGGPENRTAGGNDEGVPVINVSPNGPAANAGIRAGDVLLSVDGKALRREGGRSPQRVLINHMEGVEPGARVAVEYRRDGKTNKVDVIAQALTPPFAAARALPVPGGPGAPGIGFFRGAGTFGALELVSLTPKLGQYFGTETGLLVVRAPTDSRLGLEEGDVIVDIAGRVPTTPAHAMRIFDTYQPGEKLTLNVLRQKKKVALSVEIPADTRRGDIFIERRLRGRGPEGGPPFNVPVPSPVPRSVPLPREPV